MSTPHAATRPNTILAVLLLAGLSFALSQTMVVPALPTLSRELGASAAASSWLLTGYLLSASVATPIVGKLGDLFGKGRVLTIVLLVFATGSTICALADSIEVMIVGRVISGVAGGVFPLSFGIIRDTFPRERVPGAIGLLSAVFGIGGGIGLPLSGVVVDNFDLSIIFWLGLIAVPAAAAAHFLVPESPTVRHARIDWLGAALLSGALVCVLLGVTEANDWGWTSPATLGLIGLGVVFAIAWIRVEDRREEPLVDMRLLRKRAVASTNLAGLLIGFAMFSSFLLIPQFGQAPESTGYGFGLSVTESGLLLVPSSIVMLFAGPLAGSLGARYGFRLTLAMGTLFATASFLWLVFEHGDPWQFVVSACLLGAGIAFAFSSMANLVVGSVPQEDVGVATGINTIMRTVGGAFGSAVATAILTGSTLAGTPIPTEGAYTAAFVLAAGGGLLAFGAALLIPRDAARTAQRPAAEPSAAPARG